VDVDGVPLCRAETAPQAAGKRKNRQGGSGEDQIAMRRNKRLVHCGDRIAYSPNKLGLISPTHLGGIKNGLAHPVCTAFPGAQTRERDCVPVNKFRS